MGDREVQVELGDTERALVEVLLGHLAIEEEDNDPEAALEYRMLASRVMDGKPLKELDWHTVWIVLDRKEIICHPAQPYDEDLVADNAKEKIDEAVGGIPDHHKTDK